MTASSGFWWPLWRVRGACHQVLMVILINVPTVSFGLALGWVSLASGEAGDEAGAGAGAGGAVIAAATTFVASLAGVPLSAYALSAGRKLAVICTSFVLGLCWALKLASAYGGGPWWLVCARICAGLGGAATWALAPLLAREMCDETWYGAAASVLPLAHNAGVLLMYLAADAQLPIKTVLWWCLGISVCHCFVFLFVPESPSYLAAKGKVKEARASLAWLRGRAPADPALEREVADLPPPEDDRSAFKLTKAMLSDRRRRRAFVISGIAILGQEVSGVLAILQYAERVFVMARDAQNGPIEVANVTMATLTEPLTGLELASPARHAVILGAVQLVSSAIALYLVERVGRRPLIVWCAMGTGLALAAAAWCVREGAGGAGGAAGVGGVGAAAIALSVAVAADSLGMQPAPYALMGDMFHYEFRSCALMLVTAAACAGNAVEVVIFPAVAASGGLVAAIALAASLTLAYAVFAAFTVPETKGKTPEEIYDIICPNTKSITDCEAPRSDKNGVDNNGYEMKTKTDESANKSEDKTNVDCVTNCDSGERRNNV